MSNAIRTLAQGLAILWIAFLLGMIAHKGSNDISRLAERHSGGEFWVALAGYLIGNLAGGAGPASK